MIGRNVLINAIGGSLSIVLYVLIIPIQIRILGVDAFGLLAFIASLQVIFGLFDLGLSPTIAREVAIDTSPGLRRSRELLQTLTVAYGGIGLLLGMLVILGADWLVTHWLQLGPLPVDAARSTLQLGALGLILRWPITFLTGVISGRERFGILNVLRTATAVFRQLGGVIVLILLADLVAFAAWLALASLVEAVAYLAVCFRVVPGLSLRPRLSRQALAEVWRFALSVSVTSVLSVALAHSDRLLLSALVPLEVLGYYSLAYSVLHGVQRVQAFMNSALFPSFAASSERGATEKLTTDYNLATQGLIYLCALPYAALTFFGEDILRVWMSAETAPPAARIMSVLAPGFLLGTSVAVAATLAIASGNAGIVIRVYAVGLAVYIPLLFVAINQWGGVGAAAAWLLTNVLLLCGLQPLVQRRVLGRSTNRWLVRNLAPFVLLGGIVFGGGRRALTLLGWESDLALLAGCAVAAVLYGVCGLFLLDPALRRAIRTAIGRMLAAPAWAGSAR